jgi:hypothetical protein
MTLPRAATAALAGALAALFGASAADAAPGVVTPSMTSTSCSNSGAIRVNVPYVPYTYCYTGTGSRRVNLTQVNSIESRNWTITFLWKPPGGSWRQSSLTSNNTFYTQGGTVDTISSP